MVAYRFVFAGVVAAASVSATPANDDHFFASLKKRQAPGTPAYNCHDNCGLAITLSREDGPCENDRFLNAYGNCIQCSGPDNYNIWRYYGFTLTGAGEECGLETTPKSGKQPDVPPAGSSGPPGGIDVSSGPAPEPEPTTGGGSQPSAQPPAQTTGGAEEPPAETPTPTGGAPEPTGPAETGAEVPSGTGSPSESTVESPISSAHSVVPPAVTATGTYPVPGVPHPSGSGAPYPSGSAPYPSGNGTASYTMTPPAEQTVNAAAGLEIPGMFGAVVLGMMYGLGN